MYWKKWLVLSSLALSGPFMAMQQAQAQQRGALSDLLGRNFSQSYRNVKRKNRQHCQKMDVGQAKRINLMRSASPTGVYMKYTLVRSGPKTYQVYLNPNFEKKDTYDGVNYENLNKGWKQRLQKCFDDRASSLKDGQGRQLRLHIWNKYKDQSIPRPPVVDINLKASNTRSNVFNYEANVGCGTLVHEAFHLMGLVDEYKERWTALNPHVFQRLFKPYVSSRSSAPAFDCRSPAPRNSLMANHHYINWRRNILKSGHVDTVIYPNCQRKNSLYYQCSSNAYKTSKDHGAIFGCQEVPRGCLQKGWAGI